ncbi:hypothetical protein [Methylopila sp. 73B]|uniref:hypothetical protein n=1 Tax=Methylopila sp. 73B TaxID=1120792 RepID=UPI00037529FF|nr:hypothetical protein [Methylopila sp. 73B]
MTAGVVYIAFGVDYVAEAVHSARSLKQHTPVPVTLFTDMETSDLAFDQVVRIKVAHKRAKVDFISRSPYERTLYLDSDTRVVRDVSDIFETLGRFDIAATHDLSRKSSRWAHNVPEYDAIPYSFPEYNGGVLAYRSGQRTADFLGLWRDYFYQYRDRTNGQDQASLRVALWKSEVSVHTLPVEYNVRSRANRTKIDRRARTPADESLLKPRILHWHGLDRRNPLNWLNPETRPFRY